MLPFDYSKSPAAEAFSSEPLGLVSSSSPKPAIRSTHRLDSRRDLNEPSYCIPGGRCVDGPARLAVLYLHIKMAGPIERSIIAYTTGGR